MSKFDVLPIDVIIPVYNGERYIEEAICSVLAQTRLPKQLIVVNDGSTDRTETIVKQFKATVPIVQIIKKNGGLSSARNAGIAGSISPYLAFLDVDDRWEPTKLERQWAVFQNSTIPKLGVVYCDYYIMNSQGVRVEEDRFKLNPAFRGNLFEPLLNNNIVASSGSGVLVKRDCFTKAGNFDESLANSEDWDMWLRIAVDYNYDYTPEQLVGIRRHQSNMSNDIMSMMNGLIRVLNKHANALLRYPAHFRSPGNAAYAPLALLLVKDITNRQFMKLIWQAMSPDLKKHFLRQLPFVLTDLTIKAPPFLIKRLIRTLRHKAKALL